MTSELDRFIGPREHPVMQLPPQERLSDDERLLRMLQGGTHWHCEERLRLTLDAFFECWPDLMPRSPELRRMHYAAARTLVTELGEIEAPAFVRWAATVIAREHGMLSIKTMRSLLFLLADWRKRDKTEHWWSKPCPRCFTIHHPEGACDGEDSDDE